MIILPEKQLATFDDQIRLAVLYGIPGSGKTSILRHLEEKYRHQSVRVDLNDYNPGHSGEQGEKASVGAVEGSFQYFRRLLEMLLKRVASEAVVQEFREYVLDTLNVEVHDAKVIKIEDFLQQLNTPLAPETIADAWRRAARVYLSPYFADKWNGQPNPPRRWLLFDNVDKIADQEIGLWLGELIPRLKVTTVVLTRESVGALPGIEIPDDDIRCIERFDESTVQRWFETVGERVDDQMAQHILRASDGHPATIALVHDLLWGTDIKPEDRLRLLQNLPQVPDERVAALATQLVQRLNNDLLSRALHAAAIPRQCDGELLRHLLGKNDGPIPKKEVDQAFDRLARFSFVEVAERSPLIVRLHPFVRRGLMSRMNRLDPALFTELNSRAAKYYKSRITGGDGSYEDAFDQEDEDWQFHKREWLYHSSLSLHDKEKRRFIRDFSQLFLEAFWWWGSYIHFDFCDRLVADLDHLVEHRRTETIGFSGEQSLLDAANWPEIESLLTHLRCILSNYPPRSVKSEASAWMDVRDALLKIQHLCGLFLAKKLTRTERRLSALLHIFLAHTFQYQNNPDGKAAGREYDRAIRLLGSDWNAAWAEFEWADMLCKRNYPDDAIELNRHWKTSAELVQPTDPRVEASDEELVANLHRLRADVL